MFVVEIINRLKKKKRKVLNYFIINYKRKRKGWLVSYFIILKRLVFKIFKYLY